MSMLYLASGSPRRRELLEQIGVPFTTLPTVIDETPLPNEPAVDYVRRLACAKAQVGLASLAAPGAAVVLGADTSVVLDGRILGKPQDRADALAMLTALSGHTHEVLTAVALATPERCDVRLVTTNVAFRKLDEAEIEAYWRTGEPCDKAGAYAIQGIAGKFVSRIEGSYSAVVGLPLLETDLLIKQHLEQTR